MSVMMLEAGVVQGRLQWKSCHVFWSAALILLVLVFMLLFLWS
jgi:hypothetical protein